MTSASWWVSLVILCAILGYATVSDLKTRTIPNWLNLLLAIFGVGLWFAGADFPAGGVSLGSRLLGLLACSLPLLVSIPLGNQIGAGDVKLIGASGLMLGWQYGLIALFIGSALGAIYAAWLKFGRGADGSTTFAYGPFLCAGILIAATFGPQILSVL